MELRPVALDDLGLDAAVRRQVDEWAKTWVSQQTFTPVE
jgi:signal transduction histidine kinase